MGRLGKVGEVGYGSIVFEADESCRDADLALQEKPHRAVSLQQEI
jgi:hypothetical protein